MTETIPAKPTVSKMKEIHYSFSQAELQAASERWGCNCGPAALAVMCNTTLDVAHGAIPNFNERHYTSPTMMKAALAILGVPWRERVPVFPEPADGTFGTHTLNRYGLSRIQFEGPWTAPGANPKWAYRITHWVGSLWTLGQSNQTHGSLVFDVNMGWGWQDRWEKEIIPELVKLYPRATGGWFVTHRWELWPEGL